MKKWLVLFAVMIIGLCFTYCAAESAADLSAVQAGSIVLFGRYEQDNDPDDGAEPIEWIVLDVQDGKVLLISRYGLDAQPYNTGLEYTWETCTLRTWLNSDFLNTAFSEQEQQAILLTDVDNSSSQDYSEWNTSGGNNTQDQIFLLSYAEAHQYLDVENWDVKGANKNIKARISPTAYARRAGAMFTVAHQTEDREPAADWWLRASDIGYSQGAYVKSGGELDCAYADSTLICVRPAMWIHPESLSGIVTESKTASADDIITFGHYEQDNDLTNGKEPIEWIVLDVQDRKALLVSRYCLYSLPYSTEPDHYIWETCTLRLWLNETFLNDAFNADEQAGILLTCVFNNDGQGFMLYDSSGGSNTQDRIFLLSYKEAHQYLDVDYKEMDNATNNMKSRTSATAYAIEEGAVVGRRDLTADGKAAGSWWLRSPGLPGCVARVLSNGALHDGTADARGICVRPAMWIDLDIVGDR